MFNNKISLGERRNPAGCCRRKSPNSSIIGKRAHDKFMSKFRRVLMRLEIARYERFRYDTKAFVRLELIRLFQCKLYRLSVGKIGKWQILINYRLHRLYIYPNLT